MQGKQQLLKGHMPLRLTTPGPIARGCCDNTLPTKANAAHLELRGRWCHPAAACCSSSARGAAALGVGSSVLRCLLLAATADLSAHVIPANSTAQHDSLLP